MLELRDTELELVPIVAGDEAELTEEIAQAVPRPFADAKGVAPPAARELVEQRTELVDPRSEEGAKPVEGVAVGVRPVGRAANALVHAASSGGAAAGALAWRPRR